MKTKFLLLLACALVLSAFTAAAQPLILPYSETFTSLDVNWHREVSADARLNTVHDGMDFNASLHSRAHVQRELGDDLVSVSARISGWTTLYLVWDDQNWCGIGQVSPTPFGRLYSTSVITGKTAEIDHRGIDFGLARFARIVLGKNFVTFSYGNDGRHWIELRTIARPSEFNGAPKLIAAGKYYSFEDHPFADDAAAATNAENNKLVGYFGQLHVEALPDSEAALGDSELQKRLAPKIDPVSAQLAENNDDPSFEKIVGFYPPFKSPREVVGVPAHPIDIGIDWLGRMDLSPWAPAIAWFGVGQPAKPIGRADVPFKRRLLKGYLPVDTLTTTKDGVDYELTFFGWSEGGSVDKPLYAYARLVATAASDDALPASVSLLTPTNTVHGWPLTPGRHHTVTFCVRYKQPEAGTAEQISPDEFTGKQNEIIALWEKQLAPGNRFEIPDARVMEAYRAWLVYSMLNWDTVNGYIEPHDGAGFYEEMFGCSVSLHTRALDYFGFPDYATRILDTQLHFQQADGLYTQACGLTDPGSLLIALAKHYQMTGDRAWLRRVSPNIIKQCDWLMRERKKSPDADMIRGLIKFRPYNDYQEPVYNFLGNAWCAEGIEDVAPLLKEIGLPEGDKYSVEAAGYRRDLLNDMTASIFTRDGHQLLPLEPETHRLLKLSKYGGGDYYGLTSSSLLETEFLPFNDQRASMIVEALEKRGGLIAGVCEFEGGIDHAYTYGYLMTEMQREKIRKTLLGFWSMLAFGMTRDTYSPVEVTMIETGENHYTLPHLYSCTDQLRLLRNLLIREDGQALWIGEAMPRAWLESGKHVAVKKAPTEFGEVSFRIESENNGAVRVRLEPPTRRVPSEIRLRLRDPRHRAIANVTGARDFSIAEDGETIVLKNLAKPVSLKVSFKNN